jgi:branched-subunit amino acid transport protein
VTTWIVMLAVGAGSYALRLSMLALLGRTGVPAWLASVLPWVAPAVIGGLVAAMVLTPGGSFISDVPPELIAVAAGFVAVRRTGNVVHAFTAGMPVMWLLTALGM